MWVGDGSTELSFNGNRLECKQSEQRGSQIYNAIWKEEGSEDLLKSGKAYWKIKCENISEEGGIFVGITDSEKFKKGWGFNGLMYGGNLSDGGALLVASFGPWPKTGDTVGIFVDCDGDNLKIYFDVNGSSLGLSYDVDKSTLSAVIPAVHFSGPGSATIERVLEYPGTTRVPEKFEGIEGKWKYSSGHITPIEGCGSLNIKKINENSYNLHIKVVNGIGITLSRDGSSGPWRSQLGASTMMMGSPEHMRLEKELSQLFNGSLIIEELDSNLSIKNAGDGKDSVWQRYTPTKEPVRNNPFN